MGELTGLRRQLQRACEALRAAAADGLTGEALEFVWWRHRRAGWPKAGALRSLVESELLGRRGAGRGGSFDPWPLGACAAATSGRPGSAAARWQPAPDGAWLEVIPVMAYQDRAPRCIDMVAFDPAAPRRWWRRTGAVPLLGADGLEAALELAEVKMRLHSTPLGCWNALLDDQGRPERMPVQVHLCLLEPASEEAAAILRAPNELVLDDEAAAEAAWRLRDRLRRAEMKARWPWPRMSYVEPAPAAKAEAGGAP